MHKVRKWSDTLLLQNFESVPDHFGTLCIKELKDLNDAGILAPKFNPILRKN